MIYHHKAGGRRSRRSRTHAFSTIIELLVFGVAEDGGGGVVLAVFGHTGVRVKAYSTGRWKWKWK